MKPKFETVELLSPNGEVVELKVVKRGLAQVRPEPIDRHKPAWLRATLPTGARYQALKQTVEELRLHTVCQEALCPNVGECWTHGTLTVMILGDICTRACKFCAVHTGNPKGLVDLEEPLRVAEAIARLGIRYVVLTSVDRDDLPDGGAAQFAATIRAIKEKAPGVLVEALTPDFQGDLKAVETVLDASPEVYAQNLETVRRLTPKVRDPRAGYEQTLRVLAHAKRYRPGVLTKSSLMLGLGETEEEILEAMRDLRAAGVDILTLGQYLRPTPAHLPVERYVPPEDFKKYEAWGYGLGFREVFSGPLVRSSYRADRVFLEATAHPGPKMGP
ncbi:MAG: lipoyl synthase [Thermus sp.]|uniref:lipoyl synthase n=1 Tax=Thermus sp. TaxID=275 RepID=UPI0025E3A966|nr:lipoyl synthase [Thermus sp.]MCS6869055.1 lipoyl synthase [Thermus sp.]MCS7217779.1 lipoyl synthase [Thermus sp.]MCX7849568.1 lipoyl synthase [Thermus sp.]MDW8016597.1 lipoyl synthase [Thermus sp.]MDW8356496.1 lipoyl synthase [Thermus sp.]